MTYAAFVWLVDHRLTLAKLRTFSLALRCPNPASNQSRDTHLAAAVIEIVRRGGLSMRNSLEKDRYRKIEEPENRGQSDRLKQFSH
jgi:hypothetical protein